MKPERNWNIQPDKLISRLGFRMWISFTLLACVITILFWLILSNSVRLSYESENVAEMDRMLWTAAGEYGEDTFFEQLQLMSDGQNYFIEIIDERNRRIGWQSAAETAAGGSGFPDIVPDNLFSLLDDNGGDYSFRIADANGSSVWTAHAVVIANIEGYRQVLVFGRSLVNVDSLVQLFGKRVIFAFIAVLVIAFFLALLITRALAGPLWKLTEKAQRLAQGDYSVQFDRTGYYEVRELSDTLSTAADEFQATERMRREFIANISHDMRTPLTVIKMYAEMIQTVSGNQPAKREEHLQRILTESEKLNAMINDTMDLAKLQSGTFDVKIKSFNLTHLIRSVISSFDTQTAESRIDIRLEADETLMASADRKLTARVLQNYISNAIKFSPRDAHILIKSFQTEQSLIRTEVQDFGPGIPAEDIPNVWTRYYTVDPYGNNKYGTGLGLNIVSEIMKIHAMPYGVDSSLGKGSIFWFCLKTGNDIQK